MRLDQKTNTSLTTKISIFFQNFFFYFLFITTFLFENAFCLIRSSWNTISALWGDTTKYLFLLPEKQAFECLFYFNYETSGCWKKKNSLFNYPELHKTA